MIQKKLSALIGQADNDQHKLLFSSFVKLISIPFRKIFHNAKQSLKIISPIRFDTAHTYLVDCRIIILGAHKSDDYLTYVCLVINLIENAFDFLFFVFPFRMILRKIKDRNHKSNHGQSRGQLVICYLHCSSLPTF
jgi:hypothetical protein